MRLWILALLALASLVACDASESPPPLGPLPPTCRVAAAECERQLTCGVAVVSNDRDLAGCIAASGCRDPLDERHVLDEAAAAECADAIAARGCDALYVS